MIDVGDELPPLSLRVTRADLVRYAGASGDFNPIHWSDRVAIDVGLHGVVAHGMLTMALAGRLVTRWATDPGAVRSYGVRFTRPVVVPDDDDGAAVELAGTVSEMLDAPDGVRIARIAITARFENRTVLGRASAEVVVPPEWRRPELPMIATRSMLPPPADRGEHDMKFAKLVDKAWEDKTAAEILAAPPSALEGLTEKHDETLKGLGIKTVADLGKWKYAQRAAALVALRDLDK